jgi:hypothetical protein
MAIICEDLRVKLASYAQHIHRIAILEIRNYCSRRTQKGSKKFTNYRRMGMAFVTKDKSAGDKVSTDKNAD